MIQTDGKILSASQNAAPNRAAWPRWALLVALLLLVLLAAGILGAPVPLSDLWSSDAGRVEVARRIFWRTSDGWGLRPVRLTCGLLVGASLASSGAALQAAFRNPLAEPYLLGISSGGALGATLASAWRLPSWRGFEAAFLMAFGGAVAASSVVYRLGQGGAGFDRSRLLLSGVALSSFLGALMALVIALSSRADLAQQTTFWLLGSLTRATPAQNVVLLVGLVAGLVLLKGSTRDLNALRAGDEEAASLGVRVAALHRRLLLASALMSAAAVASAGLIGFVGLLAPHAVRLLFGSDARSLIPASALGGALLLCACDALARSALPPLELPVGIVTALLGVPLFLFLARRA